MIASILIGVAGYKPVTCGYRQIKVAPKTLMSRVSNKRPRLMPQAGDWRLYLNGKPTSFFERNTGIDPTIIAYQRIRSKDVYLQSTVTTSGAILDWTNTLLFWDRSTLKRVDCPSLDVLEFNPDGRLIGIVQSNTFTAVGKADIGWEMDRHGYIVVHGKATDIGGAVDMWFERDGTIRGISNGTGSKVSPHYFTFARGHRKDGPVGTVQAPSKRLFGF